MLKLSRLAFKHLNATTETRLLRASMEGEKTFFTNEVAREISQAPKRTPGVAGTAKVHDVLGEWLGEWLSYPGHCHPFFLLSTPTTLS